MSQRSSGHLANLRFNYSVSPQALGSVWALAVGKSRVEGLILVSRVAGQLV